MIFLAFSESPAVVEERTSSEEITSHILKFITVLLKGAFFLTSSVPSTVETTIGAPLFVAILKEPAWKGSIPSALFLVPSG